MPAPTREDAGWDITDPANYHAYDIREYFHTDEVWKDIILDHRDVPMLKKYLTKTSKFSIIAIFGHIQPLIYKDIKSGHLFFAYGPLKQNETTEFTAYKTAREVGFDNMAELRILSNGIKLSRIVYTYSDEEIMECHAHFEDILLLLLFLNTLDHLTGGSIHNLYKRLIQTPSFAGEYYQAYDLELCTAPQGIYRSLSTREREDHIERLKLTGKVRTKGINWNYMYQRIKELLERDERENSGKYRESLLLLLDEVSAIREMVDPADGLLKRLRLERKAGHAAGSAV